MLAISRQPARAGEPGLAKPGMTLVEMLVVVLISVVVTAAAFTLYRVNVTTYVKEDARLERDQNLRTALQTVARDARMAGNGLALLGSASQMKLIQVWTPGYEKSSASGPAVQEKGEGWFCHADKNPGAKPCDKPGARAIFGVDGGTDGPDTLTIFHSEAESGAAIGQLKNDYKGEASLTLAEKFPNGALREGDILALVNGDRAALLEAGAGFDAGGDEIVPVNLGGRFPAPAGEWGEGFPADSLVYDLRNATLVTYYLDEENHNLMADYHRDLCPAAKPDCGGDRELGRVAVASNIDDFQVFYYYGAQEVKPDMANGEVNMSSDELDKKRVKAVALGLVSISARDEPGQAPRHKRPALFNRLDAEDTAPPCPPGATSVPGAPCAPDRRPRNSLTEIIFLRNF